MRAWFRAILGVSLGLGLMAAPPSTARAGFRAGVAVRIVTPQPLLPVSGGLGPAQAVTRKLGEITVRALVLADDHTRVAWVTTDFLGFPAVLGDRVRHLVRDVPPDNVLIAATHTHSAPDCYGIPDGRGGSGADLGYLDSVVGRIAEAIHEAATRAEPATLKVATGEVHGKIAYNAYAEALFDPRCSVIQLLDARGHPLATLVNYAVHPEVLGSAQGVLSPDLVGPLVDRLAERGAGVGLFFNGAVGGMITADNRGPDGKSQRSWSECVRIGTLLADEALRLLESAPVQIEPTLACASRRVAFSVDSPELRTVLTGSPLGYRLDADGRIGTRINLVDLGNAQVLTIPGEALPNVGAYLKRKMRGEHNLLFGLTNDAFGYILAAVDWGSFRKYAYVSRVSLGESTGEVLIQAALGLVADTPRPGRLEARRVSCP